LHALQKDGLSVIAEVKRKSPSAGEIQAIQDPVALAKHYEAGGAAALSVLTDAESFGGALKDLELIVKNCQIPALRKDFVVDPLQIAEAILVGASAVLLIVSVLGEKTTVFLRQAEEMGIDALVEVHDEEELKIAVQAGAKIIGINSRDLKTFTVDLARAEHLVRLLPEGCVKVAESGIKTVADARRMHKAGFDAVLIGETLVRSGDPKKMIEEIHDAH